MRRYPKMRERMPGFRINPASPLWCSLLIAPLDYVHSFDQEIPFFLRGKYTKVDRSVGSRPQTRFDPLTHRWVLWQADGLEYQWPVLIYGDCTVFYGQHQINDTEYVAIHSKKSVDNILFGVDATYPNVRIKYGSTSITMDASSATFVVGRRKTGTRSLQGFLDGVLLQDVYCYESPAWDASVYTWTNHLAYTAGSSEGVLFDLMLWLRILSDNEIKAISDSTNIDYRVNGVPLLLPPRRVIWPVAAAAAPPAFQPAWAQNINTYIGLGVQHV